MQKITLGPETFRLSVDNSVFIPNCLGRRMGISSVLKLCWGQIAQRSLLVEDSLPIDGETLTQILGITRRQTATHLQKLLSLGLIEEIKETGDIEIKEYVSLCNYNPAGVGDSVCAWCKSKCLVIQKHHYPVPRLQGGAEVVEICPNCHCAFHMFKNTKRYRAVWGTLEEAGHVEATA